MNATTTSRRQMWKPTLIALLGSLVVAATVRLVQPDPKSGSEAASPASRSATFPNGESSHMDPANSSGSQSNAAVLTRVQMDLGKQVYERTCFACHQHNGQGLPGVFPPLAKADYLMADKERSIRIVIHGQVGEIVVNGKKYKGVMPPIMINDEQVAAVLTYVRNSWGNSGEPVTVEEVRKVRGLTAGSAGKSQ